MDKRMPTTGGLISLLITLAVVQQSATAVTIETVPIGNPGNPADTEVMTCCGTSIGTAGYGSVGYSFRMGKTEVTNAQYVEFLNKVDPTGANTLALYDSFMTSRVVGGFIFNSGAANGSKFSVRTGRDNNPVVYVSWYDSIRFANWLHNGQGGPGTTEDGAYTLLGGTPTPSNSASITRNLGAKWWLPNEHEWYKAAYHKNDGATGNYWNYPTSTDAVPYSDQPPGSGTPDASNTANFFKDDGSANGYDDGYSVTGSPTPPIVSVNLLTDVGAYTSALSPYGTFDQGGNVWEWNEALISGSVRGVRGGVWGTSSNTLHASYRIDGEPDVLATIGFRVASIPEPASITLCLAGVLALTLSRRWRQ